MLNDVIQYAVKMHIIIKDNIFMEWTDSGEININNIVIYLERG